MQPVAQEYLLLEGAEGTIQRTENQEVQVVDRLTEDLVRGRFNVPTDKQLPCKCIDGRSCAHPTEGPNSSGGTETIFVADDLTTKRFAADGTVAGGMGKLIDELQRAGLPVGGHSDNKPDKLAGASGCGANDKLPQVYDIIARKPDLVRQYAETILGTEVSDETHRLIVSNAGGRTEFSSGQEVLKTFEDSGSDLEQLEGTHKEIVAVINMHEGTTLDRQQLTDEYGPEYQAFNVDAWSFKHAAKAISESDDEILQKIIAMTYYNVAVALVLCGPEMRIVVAN